MLESVDRITDAVNGLAHDLKAALLRPDLSEKNADLKFQNYCSYVISKVC